MLNVMSNDQLRRAAPSAFATAPWSQCTSRYTFVPTIEAIERLREAGFQPIRASQSRVRTAERREFTKHRISFAREADLAPYIGRGIMARNEQPEIPLAEIVNAHDGVSSYFLNAGLWRLVCGNGLMVESSNIKAIKVTHSGDILGRVIEGTYRVVEEFPKVIAHVDAMKQITLEPPEQTAFARQAATLRWGTDERGTIAAPFDPVRLLESRRTEDDAPTLWNTFNVVQENLIKGGLHGRTASGRRTTTRKVESVNADIELNRALWAYAEEVELAH